MCDDPNHTRLFSQSALLSSGGIALLPESILVVNVWTTFASETFLCRGHVLTEQGIIEPFELSIVPPNTRVWRQAALPLGRGVLLDATVSDDDANTTAGSSFATALIRVGPAASYTEYRRLCLGPVTQTVPLVLWPPTSPTFPGWLSQPRAITGTNPAAGAEISETVPAAARWHLVGFRAQLVTAAVAATRQVHLTIDDGTTVQLDLPANATQILSLTRNYNAGALGVGGAATDSEVYIPLPPNLVLPGGWRIKTVTTAIDAGDNWGAPQLYVEEYPEY